jgi:hypothetical protein
MINSLKKSSKESPKESPKSSGIEKKPYSKISYAVFGIALIISLISLVPVVFPALISVLVISNGFEEMGLEINKQDMFETGPLAGLLIFSNAIVFGLYIFRKKIPTISKIFSFDIPQKVSLAIVIIVIIGYGSISFSEVHTDEIYQDWQLVERGLESWDILKINGVGAHVNSFLLQQSMIIFGSYKIIPLLFSMALLGITYLFTTNLTKNRLSGLISMGLVLQSYTFLTYDTSSTYSNFWIFFYLVSLYAVVKVWFTNPVFYVASMFSKLLTAVFAPMSIFFILNCHIPKNQKIILSGIIVLILIMGALSISQNRFTDERQHAWDDFWVAFASFAFQMRFDVITVLFLVPLIFGLFITSKKNRHANSITVLIVGILFTAPLVAAMTDVTSQPYRYMPIIVFFAVGVGILFSKVNSKV